VEQLFGPDSQQESMECTWRQDVFASP